MFLIQATMFEAKTRLSELVKKAQRGERVVLTSGRDKIPVAQIIALDPPKERVLGVCYNPRFTMPADFFDPLPEEELKLWNGEGN
jgi:antitoxin (DNA-binding transcriptional repressor) of toxin-antitoxin stability system